MENQPIAKGRLYTSYGLQGLLTVMFLMGAANNLLQTETAVKGATDFGYPAESVLFLGIILLISTILYAYPKTTILGAILLTAWLGGAVATHIIHKDAVSMSLPAVFFGVLVWVSIWLRDGQLQGLFPLKN
ncbi:membrane protein [Emticicia aquatilis]|uniref:Membrane protein n=1 Tax=Emticicia aquatilis TaxID=1537369 RepID=A0A916Z097_9BACT|nr:DoxX family protein [Emticicia aquatilis]GGD69336.1 membrane protein [Emticicia aquatilis]